MLLVWSSSSHIRGHFTSNVQLGSRSSGGIFLSNVGLGLREVTVDPYSKFWPFSFDEEGWVFTGDATGRWATGGFEIGWLSIRSTVVWQQGYWRFSPPNVYAVTGAVFGGLFFFPGNDFWGVEIKYTDGDKDGDGGGGLPNGNPAYISTQVTAPNNGKQVDYFEWSSLLFVGSAALFRNAYITGFNRVYQEGIFTSGVRLT